MSAAPAQAAHEVPGPPISLAHRLPRVLDLTRTQRRILACLLERAPYTATYGAILTAIDSHAATEGNVKVHMVALRRKLAPFGLQILTDRGEGFGLDEATAWQLRLMIGRAP